MIVDPSHIVTENDATQQNPASQFYHDLETLTAVFPDCDPDFIAQRLIARMNDPDRLQNLSAEMFDNRRYPKLKDRLERERKEALRRRLMNPVFDLVEFLNMFPDPDEEFADRSQPVSELYKRHALAQLSNDFQMMKLDYIVSKCAKHKFHFAPTYFELSETKSFLTGKLPDNIMLIGDVMNVYFRELFDAACFIVYCHFSKIESIFFIL